MRDGTDDAGLTPEQYTGVFRRHAAGVAVVTADGPDGPVGFTATSVISVSADPPLLAFSVHSGSSSWPALSVARTVVVNLLAEDQAPVAARFARREHERFRAGDWARLPSGEPVLHGTQAWVRAAVVERVPAGTGVLVVLRGLTHGTTRPDARPLVYRDRSYYGLGADPVPPV